MREQSIPGHRVIMQGSHFRTEVFDSLTAAIRYGDELPCAISWDASSREAAGRSSWSGSRSWSDAKRLGLNGWPDGRGRMSRELDAARFIQVRTHVMAKGLSVGGAYPVVPIAIAGDPRCMVAKGLAQSKTAPVYRFIVNGTASANVNAETIMRRGAAILSWVDRLEADGIRCEVVVTFATEGGGGKTHGIWIMAKEAQDMLDIDRLAFALVHPAMLRRIGFAVWERAEFFQSYGSGYGQVTNAIANELEAPHSIYFRGMHGGEYEWRSPDAAVKAVEQAIAAMVQHDEGVEP